MENAICRTKKNHFFIQIQRKIDEWFFPSGKFLYQTKVEKILYSIVQPPLLRKALRFPIFRIFTEIFELTLNISANIFALEVKTAVNWSKLKFTRNFFIDIYVAKFIGSTLLCISGVWDTDRIIFIYSWVGLIT